MKNHLKKSPPSRHNEKKRIKAGNTSSYVLEVARGNYIHKIVIAFARKGLINLEALRKDTESIKKGNHWAPSVFWIARAGRSVSPINPKGTAAKKDIKKFSEKKRPGHLPGTRDAGEGKRRSLSKRKGAYKSKGGEKTPETGKRET